MAALKTTLIGAIKTGMAGMTIANGFNFNWGDIDDYIPASRVYPCSFLHFTDEIAIDEDSNTVDHYTNDFELTFETMINNTGAADANMDQCEDDYKHLMADLTTTLRAAGMIDYTYLSSERTYTNVRAHPGRLRVTFNIKYRQNQFTPSST
jgi:hypothetical protein